MSSRPTCCICLSRSTPSEELGILPKHGGLRWKAGVLEMRRAECQHANSCSFFPPCTTPWPLPTHTSPASSSERGTYFSVFLPCLFKSQFTSSFFIFIWDVGGPYSTSAQGLFLAQCSRVPPGRVQRSRGFLWIEPILAVCNASILPYCSFSGLWFYSFQKWSLGFSHSTNNRFIFHSTAFDKCLFPYQANPNQERARE